MYKRILNTFKLLKDWVTSLFDLAVC